MKTIDRISKSDLVLNTIANTESFKQLVNNLPDNFKDENLRVSFSYDIPKMELWSEDNEYIIKDGRTIHSVSREFESGFSNPDIRKKTQKRLDDKTFITERDSNGEWVTYVE